MHLLAATPGAVDDGSEAIDLGQTPGDIVILTAADTEIACLAAAQAQILKDNPDAPSVRVANLLHLGHNYSVDLYAEEIIANAKLVVGRLLGGRSYWEYGVEQITALCRKKKIPLTWIPGDDQPDAELAGLSSLAQDASYRLWQYCVQGGVDNAINFLKYAGTLIGRETDWLEPAPLLRAGIYWPGLTQPQISDLPWVAGRPVAAITFYRALYQAANTRVLDAMIEALDKAGVNALPLYAASLKDPVVAATVEELLQEAGTGAILNATSFAISTPGAEKSQTPFDSLDCPVFQMVFSGGNEDLWHENTNGLSARDIAMNVALPEVDGRILSRAVSFKGLAQRDENIQADLVEYQPVEDRCAFVADLAANWLKLRNLKAAERKVALVFANYPNRDARLGNGVGLDTPAGAMNVLHALKKQGYMVDIPFADSDALINHLAAGPTNAEFEGREIRETLDLADYQAFFDNLPQAVRDQITEKWGAPEQDPFFMADSSVFALSVFRLGNVAIGLQPARGYNINPVETYHSPDLVPPHGYLAFYAWMRNRFNANAIIHMGKHGNMEWLPGKSVALSEECFPEAVFGPLPHLYPFIVNDPGEGTQAKRRAQAVIIDHLTPPLTRAESYGPLKDLEQLVDEYFEAAGVDPRRLKILKREILDLTRSIGLDKDCGIEKNASDEDALAQLDNYLCELKELQIRDGLHIFGASPDGELLDNLLVALARVPRDTGEGADASLHRALAKDLALGDDFDPLDCQMGDAWHGPKPAALDLVEAPWRTKGDVVERLEALALALVQDKQAAPGAHSAAVLEKIRYHLRPTVEACGTAEIDGILTGLDGRYVQPGTSGAPTRGRPDVLPTGRNFYSVDTRTVPTPAAWKLGWKSAQLLVERHAQEHGSYPKRVALSAWGTSNMRTGGDDIAQALALMGVQPTWDPASRRVTGFEILPVDILDRPRVDVTLRISGFFRDAFPGLIDLVDSAARAVSKLDEAEADNPLAASWKREKEELINGGIAAEDAEKRAGARIFGSKPGAYGAGLQALIDEKGWESEDDLAKAYVAWGGYAYGAGATGEAAHGLFERRLSTVEAVLHNQDNREHDLLDSDDYYQFEGGMTAAIRMLSGDQPTVYHNDHSRPESPQIRTLEEEIGRVVRARVVNPKWIDGVMRHGYKGAFEMAATVDYLFAFAATAKCVGDHHFDAVYEAYLADDQVRDFLEKHNPDALKDIADRLREALDRGLWSTKHNQAFDLLGEWSGNSES
ncbi:cobaltochelatase subunit CobN [Aestuariispira insulae]|uniref:Cobaltochelatase subunit CobN n=1 Tax=Aestuariispira insulae TaxID=1461337 RepID=A0A3D9HQ10_9PROT|nr:cobaltochelatase subunit CobN [Aestuariispira insulae]RED51577.1 cobaltochelatase CobN subunit [Aestuariispira insulae]